jgi:tRNA-dihydrouridine synthase
MRKICSSLNTSCSLAFSETALARSVPNGFSMTMRARSTRPAFAEHPHHRQGGVGRHAQVVQAAAFGTERGLGGIDGRLQRQGTGRQGT